METIAEDHMVLTVDNGPMVMGRDLRSVSFLAFTSSFPTYPPVLLVPLFMSLHATRSIRPNVHSMILDRLRGFVSIMSGLQASWLHINYTTKPNFPTFQ